MFYVLYENCNSTKYIIIIWDSYFKVKGLEYYGWNQNLQTVNVVNTLFKFSSYLSTYILENKFQLREINNYTKWVHWYNEFTLNIN